MDSEFSKERCIMAFELGKALQTKLLALGVSKEITGGLVRVFEQHQKVILEEILGTEYYTDLADLGSLAAAPVDDKDKVAKAKKTAADKEFTQYQDGFSQVIANRLVGQTPEALKSYYEVSATNSPKNNFIVLLKPVLKYVYSEIYKKTISTVDLSSSSSPSSSPPESLRLIEPILPSSVHLVSVEASDIRSLPLLADVNTPATGTCLFYSVAFSRLLPFKNSPVFKQRYEQLFGKEKSGYLSIEKFRGLFNQYDGSVEFILNHPEIERLVEEVLRPRLVKYMRDHEERFRAFVLGEFVSVDFNAYLRKMEGPTKEWGGAPEIAAFAEMLDCPIYLFTLDDNKEIAKRHLKPFNVDANDIPLFLVYTGHRGKINNHYHYLTHPDNFISTPEITVALPTSRVVTKEAKKPTSPAVQALTTAADKVLEAAAERTAGAVVQTEQKPQLPLKNTRILIKSSPTSSPHELLVPNELFDAETAEELFSGRGYYNFPNKEARQAFIADLVKSKMQLLGEFLASKEGNYLFRKFNAWRATMGAADRKKLYPGDQKEEVREPTVNDPDFGEGFIRWIKKDKNNSVKFLAWMHENNVDHQFATEFTWQLNPTTLFHWLTTPNDYVAYKNCIIDLDNLRERDKQNILIQLREQNKILNQEKNRLESEIKENKINIELTREPLEQNSLFAEQVDLVRDYNTVINKGIQINNEIRHIESLDARSLPSSLEGRTPTRDDVYVDEGSLDFVIKNDLSHPYRNRFSQLSNKTLTSVITGDYFSTLDSHAENLQKAADSQRPNWRWFSLPNILPLVLPNILPQSSLDSIFFKEGGKFKKRAQELADNAKDNSTQYKQGLAQEVYNRLTTGIMDPKICKFNVNEKGELHVDSNTLGHEKFLLQHGNFYVIDIPVTSIDDLRNYRNTVAKENEGNRRGLFSRAYTGDSQNYIETNKLLAQIDNKLNEFSGNLKFLRGEIGAEGDKKSNASYYQTYLKSFQEKYSDKVTSEGTVLKLNPGCQDDFKRYLGEKAKDLSNQIKNKESNMPRNFPWNKAKRDKAKSELNALRAEVSYLNRLNSAYESPQSYNKEERIRQIENELNALRGEDTRGNVVDEETFQTYQKLLNDFRIEQPNMVVNNGTTSSPKYQLNDTEPAKIAFLAYVARTQSEVQYRIREEERSIPTGILFSKTKRDQRARAQNNIKVLEKRAEYLNRFSNAISLMKAANESDDHIRFAIVKSSSEKQSSRLEQFFTGFNQSQTASSKAQLHPAPLVQMVHEIIVWNKQEKNPSPHLIEAKIWEEVHGKDQIVDWFKNMIDVVKAYNQQYPTKKIIGISDLSSEEKPLDEQDRLKILDVLSANKAKFNEFMAYFKRHVLEAKAEEGAASEFVTKYKKDPTRYHLWDYMERFQDRLEHPTKTLYELHRDHLKSAVKQLNSLIFEYGVNEHRVEQTRQCIRVIQMGIKRNLINIEDIPHLKEMIKPDRSNIKLIKDNYIEALNLFATIVDGSLSRFSKEKILSDEQEKLLNNYIVTKGEVTTRTQSRTPEATNHFVSRYINYHYMQILRGRKFLLNRKNIEKSQLPLYMELLGKYSEKFALKSSAEFNINLLTVEALRFFNGLFLKDISTRQSIDIGAEIKLTTSESKTEFTLPRLGNNFALVALRSEQLEKASKLLKNYIANFKKSEAKNLNAAYAEVVTILGDDEDIIEYAKTLLEKTYFSKAEVKLEQTANSQGLRGAYGLVSDNYEILEEHVAGVIHLYIDSLYIHHTTARDQKAEAKVFTWSKDTQDTINAIGTLDNKQRYLNIRVAELLDTEPRNISRDQADKFSLPPSVIIFIRSVENFKTQEGLSGRFDYPPADRSKGLALVQLEEIVKHHLATYVTKLTIQPDRNFKPWDIVADTLVAHYLQQSPQFIQELRINQIDNLLKSIRVNSHAALAEVEQFITLVNNSIDKRFWVDSKGQKILEDLFEKFITTHGMWSEAADRLFKRFVPNQDNTYLRRLRRLGVQQYLDQDSKEKSETQFIQAIRKTEELPESYTDSLAPYLAQGADELSQLDQLFKNDIRTPDQFLHGANQGYHYSENTEHLIKQMGTAARLDSCRIAKLYPSLLGRFTTRIEAQKEAIREACQMIKQMRASNEITSDGLVRTPAGKQELLALLQILAFTRAQGLSRTPVSANQPDFHPLDEIFLRELTPRIDNKGFIELHSDIRLARCNEFLHPEQYGHHHLGYWDENTTSSNFSEYELYDRLKKAPAGSQDAANPYNVHPGSLLEFFGGNSNYVNSLIGFMEDYSKTVYPENAEMALEIDPNTLDWLISTYNKGVVDNLTTPENNAETTAAKRTHHEFIQRLGKFHVNQILTKIIKEAQQFLSFNEWNKAYTQYKDTNDAMPDSMESEKQNQLAILNGIENVTFAFAKELIAQSAEIERTAKQIEIEAKAIVAARSVAESRDAIQKLRALIPTNQDAPEPYAAYLRDLLMPEEKLKDHYLRMTEATYDERIQANYTKYPELLEIIRTFPIDKQRTVAAYVRQYIRYLESNNMDGLKQIAEHLIGLLFDWQKDREINSLTSALTTDLMILPPEVFKKSFKSRDIYDRSVIDEAKKTDPVKNKAKEIVNKFAPVLGIQQNLLLQAINRLDSNDEKAVNSHMEELINANPQNYADKLYAFYEYLMKVQQREYVKNIIAEEKGVTVQPVLSSKDKVKLFLNKSVDSGFLVALQKDHLENLLEEKIVTEPHLKLISDAIEASILFMKLDALVPSLAEKYMTWVASPKADFSGFIAAVTTPDTSLASQLARLADPSNAEQKDIREWLERALKVAAFLNQFIKLTAGKALTPEQQASLKAATDKQGIIKALENLLNTFPSTKSKEVQSLLAIINNLRTIDDPIGIALLRFNLLDENTFNPANRLDLNILHNNLALGFTNLQLQTVLPERNNLEVRKVKASADVNGVKAVLKDLGDKIELSRCKKAADRLCRLDGTNHHQQVKHEFRDHVVKPVFILKSNRHDEKATVESKSIAKDQPSQENIDFIFGHATEINDLYAVLKVSLERIIKGETKQFEIKTTAGVKPYTRDRLERALDYLHRGLDGDKSKGRKAELLGLFTAAKAKLFSPIPGGPIPTTPVNEPFFAKFFDEASSFLLTGKTRAGEETLYYPAHYGFHDDVLKRFNEQIHHLSDLSKSRESFNGSPPVTKETLKASISFLSKHFLENERTTFIDELNDAIIWNPEVADWLTIIKTTFNNRGVLTQGNTELDDAISSYITYRDVMVRIEDCSRYITAQPGTPSASYGTSHSSTSSSSNVLSDRPPVVNPSAVSTPSSSSSSSSLSSTRPPAYNPAATSSSSISSIGFSFSSPITEEHRIPHAVYLPREITSAEVQAIKGNESKEAKESKEVKEALTTPRSKRVQNLIKGVSSVINKAKQKAMLDDKARQAMDFSLVMTEEKTGKLIDMNENEIKYFEGYAVLNRVKQRIRDNEGPYIYPQEINSLRMLKNSFPKENKENKEDNIHNVISEMINKIFATDKVDKVTIIKNAKDFIENFTTLEAQRQLAKAIVAADKFVSRFTVNGNIIFKLDCPNLMNDFYDAQKYIIELSPGQFELHSDLFKKVTDYYMLKMNLVEAIDIRSISSKISELKNRLKLDFNPAVEIKGEDEKRVRTLKTKDQNAEIERLTGDKIAIETIQRFWSLQFYTRVDDRVQREEIDTAVADFAQQFIMLRKQHKTPHCGIAYALRIIKELASSELAQMAEEVNTEANTYVLASSTLITGALETHRIALETLRATNVPDPCDQNVLNSLEKQRDLIKSNKQIIIDTENSLKENKIDLAASKTTIEGVQTAINAAVEQITTIANGALNMPKSTTMIWTGSSAREVQIKIKTQSVADALGKISARTTSVDDAKSDRTISSSSSSPRTTSSRRPS